MSFTTIKKEDFTILKNGIDTKLEIIRHDETGYYNITKIANIINNIKSEEKGLGGNPPNSDNRLSIIRHDETGFYNITKTSKLVHDLMNSEVSGISPTPSQPTDWFRNDKTKELFEACADLLGYIVEVRW